MKKIFLSLVCLPLWAFSVSPNFSLMPFFDFNATFISLRTKKDLVNSLELKPWIGFNSGINLGLSLTEKSKLDLAVAFKQRRNRGNPIQFANVVGELTGLVENKTIANYMGVGIIYHYKFPFNLRIGSGIELNFLVNAKTKLSVPEDFFGNPFTINGIPLDDKFKTYYFRTFNFGIPLIVSYEVKRFLFSLKFEKGILSRVKDAEIKERENTLSVGMGFLLMKEVR